MRLRRRGLRLLRPLRRRIKKGKQRSFEKGSAYFFRLLLRFPSLFRHGIMNIRCLLYTSYPSQGYDFDITSTTQYDQKFIENRDIFENIAQIVDDIFNNYVVRQGSVNPYFTQYCNGTTSTCDGLSQWGTVTLAEQGMVPYEILQYYYGDDINILFDAPVGPGVPSYPGIPLRRGDSGEDVRTIQPVSYTHLHIQQHHRDSAVSCGKSYGPERAGS